MVQHQPIRSLFCNIRHAVNERTVGGPWVCNLNLRVIHRVAVTTACLHCTVTWVSNYKTIPAKHTPTIHILIQILLPVSQAILHTTRPADTVQAPNSENMGRSLNSLPLMFVNILTMVLKPTNQSLVDLELKRFFLSVHSVPICRSSGDPHGSHCERCSSQCRQLIGRRFLRGWRQWWRFPEVRENLTSDTVFSLLHVL